MNATALPRPTLVVFSHQRWNFLFGRPQQLMSRLAGRWRVIFIEEPVFSDSARLEITDLGADLSVIVPHTPVAASGFHDDQLPILQPLLARHLRASSFAGAVAWVDTPMALPLLHAFQPACVVYDCMNELSAFMDSPCQLRQRESALMKTACLVLTGGPSLYAARHELHPNVHCLPSAVDVNHFSPARLRYDSPAAKQSLALQGAIEGPRLGYYGVIDGRLDLALVERLADARPRWQIVMAGPVVKVDRASLPRRDNLHWIGMQPYECLPYLLNGWDLALIPFALNEATRFLNPTKTLEYLAGETPVVSTALRDVMWLYGDVVDVAHSPGEFIEACERVLNEPPAQRAARETRMMSMVWTSSWQRSADSVHMLLQQALHRARVSKEAINIELCAGPMPARAGV
jgi:glycosyltransferase involved in cell wall biosynthesis